MKRLYSAKKYEDTVRTLTKIKYDFKDYRTLAQMAISISLASGKKMDLDELVLEDSDGYSFSQNSLGIIDGGRNDGIYKALINHQYEQSFSEYEMERLLKAHLDHGLGILQKDLLDEGGPQKDPIDYLIHHIQKSMSLISSPMLLNNEANKNFGQLGTSQALSIELGTSQRSNDSVSITINDENEFDSQHFAIAGMNGSGKTQLVKDILYQISETTNHDLKFIFFDYKGEGASDKLRGFLQATKCEFVDVTTSPLVFNPLISIPLDKSREKNRLIKTFRDKLGAIDLRIGIKQKNNLETAIQECFERAEETGKHPSMVDVYEELITMYEELKLKEDSLTAILKDMADMVFAKDYDPDFRITDRSLYINLPTTLPDSARKASVFLILNYLLNFFIESPDVQPNAERIKPIRYVIVIDEAHAYLKNKNMAAVLEDLLRMIRSKGVVVMMLSQGVQEYKQKNFDFSSQVKIPILLNVQNKDLKVAKAFLGTPKSERPLQDALNNLEGGTGIINFTTPKLIDINQFWKRNL